MTICDRCDNGVGIAFPTLFCRQCDNVENLSICYTCYVVHVNETVADQLDTFLTDYQYAALVRYIVLSHE